MKSLLRVIASVVGVAAGVVTIYQGCNPPPASVELARLAGDWRNSNALEGDLVHFSITVISPNSATVNGTYIGPGGYVQLADINASFAEGTLTSGEIWQGRTSVDQYRLKSAQLDAGGLTVQFEHCIVGQRGTSCTARTNALGH